MAIWQETALEPGIYSVLFLDRDGVVIVDRDYIADPAEVTLLPGAADTINQAHAMGMVVIGVSNQSGLGRGKFGLGELGKVMNRLEYLLADEGARFDGFYYCPHAPEAECECRKPKAGLLAEMPKGVAWDPATSWVVGDKMSDVDLGRRGGLGSVLVKTGHGLEHLSAAELVAAGDDCVLIANDLSHALSLIADHPAMNNLDGGA